MALNRVTLHRSGIRPHLFLGGDRELTQLSALVTFILIFICLKWWTIIPAVVLWGFSLMILRHMAKRDPLLRHVYLRHIQYCRYYPAHSRPYHVDHPVNRSIRFLSNH